MIDFFTHGGHTLRLSRAACAGLVALSAAGCGARTQLGVGGSGTGSSSSSTTGTASSDCSSVPFHYEVLAGDGAQGFGGDDGPATHAELGAYLSGMAKDAAGNLYIADAGNARIRKVDAAGVITTYAGDGTPGYSGDGGPALAAEINGPAGVAIDDAGNLYFAEFNNRSVRRIDTQGVISTFASLAGQPTGIAIDGSNNVYVAMFALETIVEITPSGKMTTVAGSGEPGYWGDGGPATAAALNNPNGVWADAHGNLFINDSGNFVIRKVDATGTISTFAGTGAEGYAGDEGPATSATIDSTYGVVVDASGEVFIADTGNDVIRMVDGCGVIHTVAGNGGTTFTPLPGPALGVGLGGPGYSWMDAAGAMYFSDGHAGVYRISR